MSRSFKVSKIAFAITAAFVLTACDDDGESSGGGGKQVASDQCKAVTVANTDTVYSGTVSNLVIDGTSGLYQYSVLQQPSNGTVTMISATGNYIYTPTSNIANNRGYKTSFDYAVIENGEQIDSAVVEIIYGAKRIMPLGDSITYGVTTNIDGTTAGDRPLPADAIGYRKALYDTLTDNGYLVDFVGSQTAGTATGVDLDDPHHEGHPGWTAEQMDAQVSGWMTNAKPDVVLLHAGTNDLGFQVQTPILAATDVHNLVSTMETWHQSNHPLTVMAAKIVRPNSSSFFNSTIANTIALNTELETQLNTSFDNSLSANFKVHIVDQYNALDVITDINSPTDGDWVGLHPSTEGYTKMAATWYAALTDSANGEILAKCD